MALRECRVTFRDVRDIKHSVVVHAETTMDAAALGLKRIREQQFVMENLADPTKLGSGIATAFVATVYGVGSANLIFLPISTKLKRKLAKEGVSIKRSQIRRLLKAEHIKWKKPRTWLERTDPDFAEKRGPLNG